MIAGSCLDLSGGCVLSIARIIRSKDVVGLIQLTSRRPTTLGGASLFRATLAAIGTRSCPQPTSTPTCRTTSVPTAARPSSPSPGNAPAAAQH